MQNEVLVKQLFLALFLAVIISFHTKAQTVLLSVDREQDSVRSDFGPNKKSFVNIYFRAGFMPGSDYPGARLIKTSSGEYGFGMRIKRKINRSFAYGFDLQWQNLVCKLKQEEGKQLPDTVLHKVERYDLASGRLGGWLRFNFDKDRGNSIGKYVDLIVSAEAFTSPKHITKDEQSDGSLLKQQTKQLSYVEPIQAHVGLRGGSGRFMVYFNYRLTPIFGDNYSQFDFPLLTAGIDISLF